MIYINEENFLLLYKTLLMLITYMSILLEYFHFINITLLFIHWFRESFFICWAGSFQTS